MSQSHGGLPLRYYHFANGEVLLLAGDITTDPYVRRLGEQTTIYVRGSTGLRWPDVLPPDILQFVRNSPARMQPYLLLERSLSLVQLSDLERILANDRLEGSEQRHDLNRAMVPEDSNAMGNSEEAQQYLRRLRADRLIQVFSSTKISDAKETISKTEECPICLRSYGQQVDNTLLPCSHVFHAECLRKWLQQCLTCPLCKKDFAEVGAVDQNVGGSS